MVSLESLVKNIHHCFSRTDGGYFFIVYNNSVYFAPIDIKINAAKAIMKANADGTGVFTFKAANARACCGNDYKYDLPHGGSGYLQHYHIRNIGGRQGKAHAWFIL